MSDISETTAATTSAPTSATTPAATPAPGPTPRENKDDPTSGSKRASHLKQLAEARETAKKRKVKREEDTASIKSKVDKMYDRLMAPAPEPKPDEEPVQQKKRKRVTRVQDREEDVEVESEEGWTTSLIRGSALVGLAGASWWFQNMYGKKKHKKEEASLFSQPQALPVQSRNKPVGSSGFFG
jgi:hypothetical protein